MGFAFKVEALASTPVCIREMVKREQHFFSPMVDEKEDEAGGWSVMVEINAFEFPSVLWHC